MSNANSYAEIKICLDPDDCWQMQSVLLDVIEDFEVVNQRNFKNIKKLFSDKVQNFNNCTIVAGRAKFLTEKVQSDAARYLFRQHKDFVQKAFEDVSKEAQLNGALSKKMVSDMSIVSKAELKNIQAARRQFVCSQNGKITYKSFGFDF